MLLASVIFAALFGAVLPDGYLPLDYLESNGSQYIDTGVTPDTTTIVTIDWLSYKAPGESYHVLLGALNANNDHQLCVYIGSADNALKPSILSTTQTPNPPIIWNQNERHVVTLDATTQSASFDGDVVLENIPRAETSISLSIYLFARSNVSPANMAPASGRLYGCTIVKGGKTVRNYVPAFEVSSGKAGLYDLENGGFSTSINGSSFPAELRVSPDDVEFREYLEQQGEGYIDTGVTPFRNMKVDVDWMSLKEPGDTFQVPFGARKPGSGPSLFYAFYMNGGNSAHAFYASSSSPATSAVAFWDKGARHVARIDGAENKSYFEGVNVIGGNSQSDTAIPATCYLFARNDGTGQAERFAQGRLYGCRFYGADGTLTKDLVPALWTYKGTVFCGLYERIGGGFLIARGAITAGGPWTPGIKQVDYITTHGREYVDTGVVPTADTKVELDWRSRKSAGAAAQTPFGARSAADEFFGLSIGETNTCSAAIAAEVLEMKDLVWNGDVRKQVALDASAAEFLVDGALKSALAKPTGAVTLPALYLFGCNRGGVCEDKASGRFHAAKIYGGAGLVRDFIPVIRNGDGAVLLYDRVFGVYFENKGTGKFTPAKKGMMLSIQ